MMTITISIARSEMEEVSHEDFDYYFSIMFGMDKNGSSNASLLLRRVHLKFSWKGTETSNYDTFFGTAYDLVEKSTGKILGRTDVYDSEALDEYDRDFQRHIVDVAESLGVTKDCGRFTIMYDCKVKRRNA